MSSKTIKNIVENLREISEDPADSNPRAGLSK